MQSKKVFTFHSSEEPGSMAFEQYQQEGTSQSNIVVGQRPVAVENDRLLSSESQRLLCEVPRQSFASTMVKGQSEVMTLQLDQGILSLGSGILEFHDSTALERNEESRSGCCWFPGSSDRQQNSIPLYNVVWAETTNSVITIHYVKTAKGAARLDEISWIISKDVQHRNVGQPDAFVSCLMSRAYGESRTGKRAYVLINPNSGPGHATKRWQQDVLPLFEAARWKIDSVVLSKGGEATSLVEKMDIDRYDTVIACSGDGGPHEVFNGLAKRSDAGEALSKIAVSHLPYGSGNAMALNLYGSNNPVIAALAIIKGVVRPLDLVSITQGSTRIVSFLSQAVGIIADCDLGTEDLRWMGPTRFEVGLFTRILRHKCYPCDVAVKVEIEEKEDIKSYYKRYANGDFPSNAQQDKDATQLGKSQGLPPLKHGSVQDPLPEGWEVMHYNNLGNFYCGNMAYMSSDANMFPAALQSDGLIDMVTMNGDLPWHSSINTFLSVKGDKFLDMPHVNYRKVSAYRITPLEKSGYISIDGERIPYEPFQAEIHKGLGRVIAKGDLYEAQGPRGWQDA